MILILIRCKLLLLMRAIPGGKVTQKKNFRTVETSGQTSDWSWYSVMYAER